MAAPVSHLGSKQGDGVHPSRADMAKYNREWKEGRVPPEPPSKEARGSVQDVSPHLDEGHAPG